MRLSKTLESCHKLTYVVKCYRLVYHRNTDIFEGET